ncbi:polysaccharide deacetylase family protein [Actinoallomurus rhizosphaericola]|uniref:polysaccharide deacetylase family protein n=1 Tax=Actinoallomurus rhizosphaericola TaxID=2952536 RepID=UPI0020920214|nr:polysaccharide deacetylase family protein [Actinoallomurus rhizosphaericola]MCO5996618.1 polysaccharide deacetylase family protein [Actinoallomurus rhizosphaericola]
MRLIASCVLAAAIGVASGVWPDVRGRVEGSPSQPAGPPAMAQVMAPPRWPAPKPGTWQVAYERRGDGLPPVVDRIKTNDKVVFITIDDGWEHDTRFVEEVRTQRVPVMVFLTDQAARTGYEYFWALQHAGAAIQDHTMDHAAPYNDMRRLSSEAQHRQICDSADIDARQYGRRPQIFRPPGGSYDQVTRTAARDCGMKSVVIWSVEFYNGLSGKLARMDGGSDLRAGDIILMHFRPGLAGDFQRLLTWIRQAGLRPAALQNYLPRSLGGEAAG